MKCPFGLFLLLILPVVPSWMEMPFSIQRCRYGNETCLVECLNGYIKTFAKGVPETYFRPFNKLPGPNFPLFNDSRNLPIGLTLNLKNLTLNGLENSTVLSVKGFERDPTQKKILIEVKIPRLECVAQFDFETKLLLFRASGNGSLNVDLQNFHLNISFKVFVEFRQGKRYLRVYDMDFQVNFDRCILWLDNLYEWNTDLTIAINRVMNEHWLEFWNELESKILQYFSRMGVERLSRFFYYFSYDEMFLNDQ